MPQPDLDIVYAVLVEWAAQGAARTYKELSHAYHAKTGNWFEPHGSWDQALGAINNQIWRNIQGPALSALVIKKETNEPGGEFWGCAPNVPSRPHDTIVRTAESIRILNDVLTYPWPNTLPR